MIGLLCELSGIAKDFGDKKNREDNEIHDPVSSLPTRSRKLQLRIPKTIISERLQTMSDVDFG